MQIYHDGGNSGIGYINYAGSNKMVLSFKFGISFFNTTRSEVMLSAVQNFNSGVFLCFDNSIKFETKSDGVKISGGLQDKDGDLGSSGQVLSSTGSEQGLMLVQDLKVLQGAVQVPQVLEDLPVLPDPLVLRVLKVFKVLRVLLVLQDLRVLKVLMVAVCNGLYYCSRFCKCW